MMMFPTPSEVIKTLDKAFFDTLTPADLSARNAPTRQDYLKLYQSKIVEFTDIEKKLLKKLVKEINRKTRKFHRFHKVEWSFVKLACTVENDYPHTLGSFIMLPATIVNPSTCQVNTLRETLIHEKLHIYQRLYPLETNMLIIDFWEYNIFDLKSKYPTARANPDINKIVYSRDEAICYQEYTSTKPKNLADSRKVSSCSTQDYEHPYEKMAYCIADIIHNETNLDPDYTQAIRWMKEYL
jgi:hypothetical protein